MAYIGDGRRKGKILAYRGFFYQKNQASDNCIYWRCSVKNCRAPLKTVILDVENPPINITVLEAVSIYLSLTIAFYTFSALYTFSNQRPFFRTNDPYTFSDQRPVSDQRPFGPTTLRTNDLPRKLVSINFSFSSTTFIPKFNANQQKSAKTANWVLPTCNSTPHTKSTND